jgi:UDP-N-acetylmuramate--alanine ligase
MRLPRHITNKVIHFVGIGGIGMSGIAEVLHSLGYSIQGSDLSKNANTTRLQNIGIEIYTSHEAENIKKADVIVVSSAVKSDNPELVAARLHKKPVMQRAEMLAEIMRFKFAVAVAGTHGKTTTTSLAAAILDAGNFDPTVVNGGIINAYNTNARLGKGDWIVVESDESDGSFTKLPATIGIITNIDPEHMEHYGTFDALKAAFSKFVENLPFYGLAILCTDHPVVKELRNTITDRRCISYGFAEDADVRAINLKTTPSGTTFDIEIKDNPHLLTQTSNVQQIPKVIRDVFLPMVGMHNVLNALSTIIVGLELDMSEHDIKTALLNFKGVKRRFTKVGESQGVTVIDDYAHHPVEIQTVLNAAVQSTSGNIIAVLQPHRFTRLRDLFDDFSTCYTHATTVVLAPVYSAGEEEIAGINSAELAKSIRKQTGLPVHEIKDSAELAPLISQIAKAGDLVVCMGAGSITYWANELTAKLDRMPITGGHTSQKNQGSNGI